MPEALKIRAMVRGDLAAVVAVHCEAFQGFFLTRMGPAFVRSYYQAVLDYPGSVSLVAANAAGKVTGFVVGFRNPVDFYSHFRSRRMRLAPVILAALIRRPSLLRDILRNTARVGAETQGDDGQAGVAELSSIGVASRGGGGGSALLHAFVQEMRRRGCRAVKLTTDEAENNAVRAFYNKHGFVETGRESRGRRTLVVYILKLDA